MNEIWKKKVSLAAGGVAFIVFSISPFLFTSCSDGQNDVKYKIDGTNWSGYINGSLTDFTIDKEKQIVTYGGDSEIPEGQYYKATDLIIPDKVYDDEGNDYSVAFGEYAFYNDKYKMGSFDLTGKLSLPKIILNPSIYSFVNLSIRELNAYCLLEGSVLGALSFTYLSDLEKIIFPPDINVGSWFSLCGAFYQSSNIKDVYINSNKSEDFVCSSTPPDDATNGTIHMMGEWKDDGIFKPNNSILNKLFGAGYNGKWNVQNG